MRLCADEERNARDGRAQCSGMVGLPDQTAKVAH